MHDLTGQRVLMLLENSCYSSDGRVRREANTLAAAGCRVTVICPRGAGERWREQFGPVVAYQYPAALNAAGFLGYVVEYAYALVATAILSAWVAARHGFDVIHAHNPPDLFVLIAAFYKLLGKRFVFDQHDLAPEMYWARGGGGGNRLVYQALVFFERLSCRWADHVFAANDSYKRLEIERSGIPASRISVVRNGPEPCHLQLLPVDVSLRRDGEALIVFVGEMGEQDGVDYLLRALAHLSTALGQRAWRCVLVGDGAAAKSLRKQAADLGIGDRVEVTGWLEYRAVPRYIGAADVCVAPDPSNSYTDRSTIIKLMEYMAQAKPIVAFDLPEHRVTAADAALYAAANDEADFARQLARLMNDSALRRQLGESGRARVLGRLAWSHQEGPLLAAYRQLLCPRAVPQDLVGQERSA
jgi:glycosyltransferase involved in cell wall biosynthesis